MGSGVLVLKPIMDRGGISQRVTYDMKKGMEVDLRYETTTDEETSTYSTIESEEGSLREESSSIDVMRVNFIPKQASGSEILSEKGRKEQEARLRKMFAKYLTREEEEKYITMLKNPNMFITDYS